ncbi:MAG: hypothetical protein LBT53_05590, partial [Puniceicoccales bacterium]|nr:hypothetical protein [Puniceicoccales bacterium]
MNNTSATVLTADAAAPHTILAAALRRARAIAPEGILRGPQLAKADRALLAKRGFLLEITKGWYALTTPAATIGDTTFWHAHFWAFAAAYLRFRFGNAYALSAENSLDLWTGQTHTPAQLIVITTKGGANTL